MPKQKDLVYASPWQEVKSSAKDWDAVGAGSLMRILQHMHIIRAFEEALIELDNQGLVHGPVHTSIGQEAGAVGSIALLHSGDLITGSHRGHHQFLAKGLRHIDTADYDPSREPLPPVICDFLYRTFAEILGLAPGFCKGRGGSMHLRWAESGAMGTNAIVGGGVPIANGLAWAKKRQKQGDVVFTYFGDGAVNTGSVTESMNLAALWDLPICFFIENNLYAVSTTLEEQTREIRMSSRGGAYGIPSFRVDGMDPVAVRLVTEMALSLMRNGKGPVVIEAELYRFRHHGGGLPASAFGYRTKEEEEKWRQRDPLALVAREMIDRKWLTTDADVAIREYAQKAMSQALDRILEGEGKARKIISSLWPDTDFRDEGVLGDMTEFKGVRFEELETASGPVGDVKMIDLIASVMNRRMEADERIFVLGEDIHRLRGGTHGATRGLPERFPDRIVPTPISELGFTGLAGGVAMEGTYRPVVEIMYPDFSLVAADQIFNQIAKARHMFGGDTRMPIVIRTKVAYGSGYGSQHSMDPAGLYAMWPGWRIVAPTTPFDYVGLMNSALHCEDPVLMIEHVGLYSATAPGPLKDLDYFIPLGKAKVAKPGKAFTVLTYLSMVPLAIQVAATMGVDAEIIDLRSLDRAGIDWETIGESVRKTNNVVVLEQGPLVTSYGAMLVDELQFRFFDYLDQPVKRITGGKSSPSVSKVLERAAFVGEEEVRAGFAAMLADVGLRLVA